MTAPTTPHLGLRFTEVMQGHVSTAPVEDFAAAERQGQEADSPLTITVTVSTDDLDAMLREDMHRARLVGTVDAPALARGPLTVTRGEFSLLSDDPESVSARRMSYAMALRAPDGQTYFLDGVKH